jgi:hypothetical protein
MKKWIHGSTCEWIWLFPEFCIIMKFVRWDVLTEQMSLALSNPCHYELRKFVWWRAWLMKCSLHVPSLSQCNASSVMNKTHPLTHLSILNLGQGPVNLTADIHLVLFPATHPPTPYHTHLTLRYVILKVKVKLSLCFNWAPLHEGALGSGGIAPRILWPRH